MWSSHGGVCELGVRMGSQVCGRVMGEYVNLGSGWVARCVVESWGSM